MLKFDTTAEQAVQQQQATTRRGQFTAYTSKKHLLESDVLNVAQTEFITNLKRCFTFDLHNNGNYMAITMYNSKEKEYGYLVVDMQTLMVAEAGSIKEAKDGIMKLEAEQLKEIESETKAEKPKVAEKKSKETKAKTDKK